jgi:DNA-binding CsgD family transcriptional regulator
MQDEFWEILQRQPGVGVAIVDVEGCVRHVNPQLRLIFGWDQGDPVGRSIAELEGPEFAAERIPIYQQVVQFKTPALIRHIRQGRHTESMLWPLERRYGSSPCVLSIVRQGLPTHPPADWLVVESKLVHLGPLDRLSPQELAVMALLGRGAPLKVIATEVGLSLRSVERYRTLIARKLGVSSLAEIARLVYVAGLTVKHTTFSRLPPHQS